MNVWAAALPLLFATFAAAGDWDLSKQNARDWAVLTFQDDAGRNYGDGQLTKDTKELYFFRVKDADPKQPAEHLPIYKASLEGMRAKLPSSVGWPFEERCSSGPAVATTM